jgi:hypothetical protein
MERFSKLLKGKFAFGCMRMQLDANGEVVPPPAPSDSSSITDNAEDTVDEVNQRQEDMLAGGE